MGPLTLDRSPGTGRHSDLLDPPTTSPSSWWWPELLVTALAAAVFSYRVADPSPWSDEAATMTVCRRTVGQILDVTRTVDLVHLAFYLMAHASVQVDDSITSVRMISVVAMAAAAGVLTALGRLLGSVAVGTTAGLLLVASPQASRWAQDARPYATVTLIAVTSTLLLVSATRRPRRWRRWLGYGLSLVLLGVFNILALLLLSGHACYLALAQPARRLRWWLPAAVTGLLVVSPFLAMALPQRGQVAWIAPPPLYGLTAVYILAFGSKIVPVAVALGALAVVVISRGLPGGPAGQAFVLGGVWATVPPVVLWSVSQVMPMWDARYVLYAVPGQMLLVAAEASVLAGAAVTALRSRARGGGATPSPAPSAASTVAVVLASVLAVGGLVAVGLPAQRALRDPVSGHDENIRGVADWIAAHASRDDAVLFLPLELRDIRAVYPHDFAAVADVALARGPAESGSLSGIEVTPAALGTAVLAHRRVWLITGYFGALTHPTDLVKQGLLTRSYRLVDREETVSYRVDLYERLAA